MQFSIASESRMIRTGRKPDLIQQSDSHILQMGQQHRGEKARSIRKWLKPELCHSLALWLREGNRVSQVPVFHIKKKTKKQKTDIIREPTAPL